MSERAMRDLGKIQLVLWRQAIEGFVPLSTTELRKALLPYGTQADLHLQTLHQVLPFGWLELSEIAWK